MIYKAPKSQKESGRLCVSKITQKVMDGSFWNFYSMSSMA